jgi:MYXO-CTERM domain-containing protein
MRLALVATLLVPLAAAAGPTPGTPGFADVIVQPPRHASGKLAFTQVSHLIYLNNCMPSGCTVYPGNDDSLTAHSSIPQSQAHLAAWGWGQDSWNQLVACVQGMYAPFNVQVTDQDPGPSVNHFELMVGGTSANVGISNAGGVAPFIPCDGQLQDNVISFVFAAETSDPDYLCWAAAQETSHVFGLDHEMNAQDPMTYLTPPVKKPGFQNSDTPCGEYNNRTCWCGQPTQNSAQYLMDTMGPAHLDPASVTIDSPGDGAWVEPGFPVHATMMSQLSVTSALFQVDGANETSLSKPPLTFDLPSSLSGGDHTIAVTATDSASRQVSASITVHVTASCSDGQSCGKGFGCLGGYCLPDSRTPGGLGATCTQNTDCITGQCGTDGTDHLCTGACDGGSKCPGGYTCLQTSNGVGVCWPTSDSGGGCATGSGGSPLLALGGLGALLAMLRRKQ